MGEVGFRRGVHYIGSTKGLCRIQERGIQEREALDVRGRVSWYSGREFIRRKGGGR